MIDIKKQEEIAATKRHYMSLSMLFNFAMNNLNQCQDTIRGFSQMEAKLSEEGENIEFPMEMKIEMVGRLAYAYSTVDHLLTSAFAVRDATGDLPEWFDFVLARKDKTRPITVAEIEELSQALKLSIKKLSRALEKIAPRPDGETLDEFLRFPDEIERLAGMKLRSER